jgi:hypothetical protein
MDARESFAKEFGITKRQLHLLMVLHTSVDLYTCLELLKAKKHRSPFRASVTAQLRKWLEVNQSTPEDQIKFLQKPLSASQLKAATPAWPVHYQIPQEAPVIPNP